MMENSAVVFAAFELIMAAKNLERIGDHTTNIAEDVIYFIAGRDVRPPRPGSPLIFLGTPISRLAQLPSVPSHCFALLL